ncbi:hypothetical protein N0V88_006232 [Collariella sp. IMI 366227]|nr:hypothetical protein N0V88_006232 [Collariella sp. IMI 366227]
MTTPTERNLRDDEIISQHARSSPYDVSVCGTLDDLDLRAQCPLDNGRHFTRPSGTTLQAPAGVLEHWLPLELIHLILVKLDIPSLTTFRRVNRRAMALVNSLHQYQVLITHTPNMIRAILSVNATSFSLRTLCATLARSPPNCESCGCLAGYLYLITCHRLCRLCISRKHIYRPVKLGDPALITVAAADDPRLKKIPQVLTVPGKYLFSPAQPLQERTPVLDRRAVLEIFFDGNEERLQELESLGTGGVAISQNWWKFALARMMLSHVALVSAPVSLDFAGEGKAEWAMYCKSCMAYRRKKFLKHCKEAGISVTIFEQAESLTSRPRDWNLGIYWAQTRIEECLTPELNALVNTVQTDPAYRRHEESVLPVYNGATGELLKDLPAPHAIRLKRRAWLNLIRTGLDVRYSKKLTSVTLSPDSAKVTAHFTDATTSTGTLLIGADGAHSITRSFLFQSDPSSAALQHHPISSFATLTTLFPATARAVRSLHRQFYITLDPSGMFNFISLHDCESEDPGEWVWMLVLSWKPKEGEETGKLAEDSGLLLERVRELTGELVYPFDKVYRDIKPGTKTWYSSSLGYWPTKEWDSRGGRVSLAGDAAHVQTFHRGQGLGNAIADVAELQTHIRAMQAHTQEELAKAVGKYEREVWKRGRDVVMQNLQNTVEVHDWETVLQSSLVREGLQRDRELE